MAFPEAMQIRTVAATGSLAARAVHLNDTRRASDWVIRTKAGRDARLIVAADLITGPLARPVSARRP
jgi:hypothetical protein